MFFYNEILLLGLTFHLNISVCMCVCVCVCAIDGLFLSGVTSLVSWLIIAFDVHLVVKTWYKT